MGAVGWACCTRLETAGVGAFSAKERCGVDALRRAVGEIKLGRSGRRRIVTVSSAYGQAQVQAKARRAGKIERLESWLEEIGHDRCNLNVERFPRGSSAQGYGAVAGPGGIKEDDIIVKIPRRAFLSEETADMCPVVRTLVREGKLTPWQTMCLHLLYERSKGPVSFWEAYIALLPTELELVGSHPLFWPQKNREEWLAGSPLGEALLRRLVQCREDTEILVAAGANEILESGSRKSLLVTESSVKWAAVTLLSRAFSLELSSPWQERLWEGDDGGPAILLVPWADMLNHSSEAGESSCLRYDSRGGVATLRAHTKYEEGDQVFDSYGPSLTPGQLLLDYGFVDDKNKNHCITLPASVLGEVRGLSNEMLLTAVGLPPDGAVVHFTESGVDQSTLAWIRAAAASPAVLSAVGWTGGSRTRAHAALARLSYPVSQDLEIEVLKRLIGACKDQLQGYPTTAAEDIAAIAAADRDGLKMMPLPWPRQQAVKALLSEKRALLGAQKMLLNCLSNLYSGRPLASLYSSP